MKTAVVIGMGPERGLGGHLCMGAASKGLIGLQGITGAFMYLYQQPRNAWTHELDLRTHLENV